MSSYSIFLNSLGKVIQRLQQNDSTNAVMKIIGSDEFHLLNAQNILLTGCYSILGRIFTKFGESKLNAMSEIGIHNLQTLLFVLASTFSNPQIVSYQSISTIYSSEFSQFVYSRINDCNRRYYKSVLNDCQCPDKLF